MTSFIHDLRLAGRALRRSPGFTAAAVGLLALAIGANTAVFSVTKAALLARLPVADPAGLFLLGEARSWGVMMGQTGKQQALSYPLYRQLRDADADFSSLAAVGSFDVEVAARVASADAIPVEVALVSGNYFSTLGVAPAAGRMLAPADDETLSAPAAVVSDGFWRRALGGSKEAVGSTVTLNGHGFTVVGVTPPGFFGESVTGTPPEIWAPLARQPEVTGRRSLLEARRPSWLYAIGRLRPGVSPDGAERRLEVELRSWLTAMAPELSPEERAAISRASFDLTPIGRGISHRREAFGRAFRLLLGAGATVLLLACGNITILLLARLARREREMEVRRALGASGVDIVRHVLAEGLVLSAAGAALGVVGALPLTRVLVRWASAVVAPGAAERIDAGVLLFAAGAALAAALLVSVAPAIRLLARRSSGATPSVASAGSARTTQAAPRAFIVLELALTLPLLVVSGLMVRGLTQMLTLDAGFERGALTVARISLRGAHYGAAELPALYRDLEARLAALPGVEASGLALYGPLSEGSWVAPVAPEGAAPGLTGDQRSSWWSRVGPGYLEALGTRRVAGRLIEPADAGALVAVVNEEFARRFFPGRSAIGARFSPEGEPATRYEVVGVVGDMRFGSLREASTPMYYAPFGSGAAGESGDESYFAGELALRTTAGRTLSAAELRAALRAANPDILLQEATSMRERVDRSTARERLTTTLCELAGALALVLAVFGIGGVVAQTTAQRTREFGLRLAVGAAPRDLLALVLGGTTRTALTGLGIGAALALGAVRIVRQELFGVGAVEWPALVAAACVLLAVSLLAGAIPAARAARLDPVEALRVD